MKGVGLDRGKYAFRSPAFEIWEDGEWVFVVRAKTKPEEESDGSGSFAKGDCRPTVSYVFESRPKTCPRLTIPSSDGTVPPPISPPPTVVVGDGGEGDVGTSSADGVPSATGGEDLGGGVDEGVKPSPIGDAQGVLPVPSSSEGAVESPVVESPVASASGAPVGRQVVQNRIVGGEEFTDPSIKKVLAFLRFKNGNCTGIVLSKNFILTAAHCNADLEGDVLIGGSDTVSGDKYEISGITTHPDYVPAETTKLPLNDLALLKLDKDISDPTLAATNTNKEFPPDNYPVTIAGYGFISEGWRGNPGPRLARSVDLPIVATPKCRTIITSESKPIGASVNDNLHLCAGYVKGGCDSCQGDSGGPVFARDGEGKILLVGVVSSGVGCARASLPGINVKISSFQKWIEDTIGTPLIISTKQPPTDLNVTSTVPEIASTPDVGEPVLAGAPQNSQGGANSKKPPNTVGTSPAPPVDVTMTPSKESMAPTPGNDTQEQSTTSTDGDKEKDDSEEESNDSSCFPASAIVELESGRFLRMDQMVIGDRVRVGVNGNKFSDVILFTHRSRNTVHNFVQVATSAGMTLSLSPRHYIYANGRMVTADHLKIGDVLPRNSDSTMTVTNLKSVQQVGLYNPQTMHGDIVVDGFSVSTYTAAVHPTLAHALLFPVRALYRLGFVNEKFVGAFFKHGSSWSQVLPKGLMAHASKSGDAMH